MSARPALPRRLAAVLVPATSAAVLLLSPAGAHAAGAAPPVLSGHEQRVVLDLIDDACGDAWCEGDYRFDFRDYSCDRPHRTCTLRLRLAPYTDEAPHWYRRSGQVTGFVRFAQMVTTSPTGTQALAPRFYEAVNTLINDIEATVPAAVPRRRPVARPG